MTREQLDEPRMSLVCARAKQGVLNRFQTMFRCACEKDIQVSCRRDEGAHTHNHSFLIFEFTVAGLDIADTVLVRSDKACRLTVKPKEKWWKALCYSELARLLQKRTPSMGVLNIAQAKISEASPELRSALDEEGRQRLVLPLAHVRDDVWVCHGGCSSKGYKESDLIRCTIQEENPSKKLRGEHLASFASTNKNLFSIAAAIATYRAGKEREETDETAMRDFEVIPSKWRDAKVVVFAGDTLSVKSLSGLLRRCQYPTKRF